MAKHSKPRRRFNRRKSLDLAAKALKTLDATERLLFACFLSGVQNMERKVPSASALLRNMACLSDESIKGTLARLSRLFEMRKILKGARAGTGCPNKVSA